MAQYSVLVASSDPKIRELARSAISEEGLDPILCGDGEEALESARASKAFPLRLLVLEAFLPKVDGFDVVRALSDDAATKEIPSLMLLDPKKQKAASPKTPARFNADDYLQSPFDEKELRAKIHSQTKYFRAHGAPHPVTGLPGHPQLETQVFNRFSRGEVFDLVSFDINFFRPFNDHYGTEKGNETIRLVAGLIEDALKSARLSKSEESAFAHIDGDDFFILVPARKGDAVRKDLRQKFQSQAQKFYTKEEIQKGFIFQKDRERKDQIFPLMRLSTAVLEVSKEKFAHYGEIVSETNELLRQSKVGSQDV